jgi:hypothetical protein
MTSVLMHEKTACPFCGEAHPLAAHTPGNDDRAPENGDLSFCFDCGEWAVFDNRLKGGCRKPTHSEYAEIATDRKLGFVRFLWLETKKGGSDDD